MISRIMLSLRKATEFVQYGRPLGELSMDVTNPQETNLSYPQKTSGRAYTDDIQLDTYIEMQSQTTIW